MQTECMPPLFEFEAVEGKRVVADFGGGTITSDAGALLLGQLDRGLDLIRRFAGCFTDRRVRRLLEHEVATLVGQRVCMRRSPICEDTLIRSPSPDSIDRSPMGSRLIRERTINRD